MQMFVRALLKSLRAHWGQIRALPHVNADHYQAFVRTNCCDVSTDPLVRLYIITAFVKEVNTQDANCLLHDSLLREVDDASDRVPAPLFRCSMLMDCSCDEQCDWQHAFGQRHSLRRSIAPFESFLAWDDTREVDVPYSVRSSFLSKRNVLLDCKGVCTISGCETKHPPERLHGWETRYRIRRPDTQRDIWFVGLCFKHRNLILRLGKKGKGKPVNESEMRAAILDDTSDVPLFKDGTTEERETILICFQANTNGIPTSRFARYDRPKGEVKWHLSMLAADSGKWPKELRLCREADAHVRTALIPGQSRDEFL